MNLRCVYDLLYHFCFFFLLMRFWLRYILRDWGPDSRPPQCGLTPGPPAAWGRGFKSGCDFASGLVLGGHGRGQCSLVHSSGMTSQGFNISLYGSFFGDFIGKGGGFAFGFLRSKWLQMDDMCSLEFPVVFFPPAKRHILTPEKNVEELTR